MEVLIRDHHDGYISWEEYDRNRKIIAGNANMKGAMVLGSVRNGSGLLVGLLRCGRCGRKFKVLHNTRRGARYVCNGEIRDQSTEKSCSVVSNMRIDAAVSAEVLRAISPLATRCGVAGDCRSRAGRVANGCGRASWLCNKRAMR